jgi:transposase-like protein
MSSKGSVGASGERRAFWQAALELQRESGLTIRAFCKQEQLAESAFHFWKRELQRKQPPVLVKEPKVRTKLGVPPETIREAFVPVELSSAAASSATAASLVIELTSGATIRVAEGCSRQLLQNVLEALRC